MKNELSTTELKRMTPSELMKEIEIKRAECAKLRIGIEMQSEKNHALYRVMRRNISRMLTVHTMLASSAQVAAPSAPKLEKKAAKSASQVKEKPVKGARSTSKKS